MGLTGKNISSNPNEIGTMIYCIAKSFALQYIKKNKRSFYMVKKMYTQTVVKILRFDEQDVVRTSATVVNDDGINWGTYWSSSSNEGDF